MNQHPGQHRPLLVALGDPARGDDGVAAAVAQQVSETLPGVRVLRLRDPTVLIEAWAGHEPVVVVDAVRSGSPSGRLHRLVVVPEGPPLTAGGWAATAPAVSRGGSHAFGLAGTIELARALRRLPTRLVVVGVEADTFGHGDPLSTAVAGAVPAAARLVQHELVGEQLSGTQVAGRVSG